MSYLNKPTYIFFILVFLLTELGWLIAGIVWLVNYYTVSPAETAKQAALGKFSQLLKCSIN